MRTSNIGWRSRVILFARTRMRVVFSYIYIHALIQERKAFEIWKRKNLLFFPETTVNHFSFLASQDVLVLCRVCSCTVWLSVHINHIQVQYEISSGSSFCIYKFVGHLVSMRIYSNRKKKTEQSHNIFETYTDLT